RPLGVGQNRSVHPQRESENPNQWNPETQQALERATLMILITRVVKAIISIATPIMTIAASWSVVLTSSATDGSVARRG
ncbi:hypothetical protein, partial [Sphingomonas sp. Leaf67]|uniref:hypothetical protein n=1 Tax=Sphingomonas sp. Leaf67 TaxID=1736230 RepID=UPI001F2590DF